MVDLLLLKVTLFLLLIDIDDTPTQLSMEVAYDLRCQSDPLRVTRHNKLFCSALCPVSEKMIALVMSDSRVMFWELIAQQVLIMNVVIIIFEIKSYMVFFFL